MQLRFLKKLTLVLLILLSYYYWLLLGWSAWILQCYPFNLLSPFPLRMATFVLFNFCGFHIGLPERATPWDAINSSLILSHLCLLSSARLKHEKLLLLTQPENQFALKVCCFAFLWRLFLVSKKGFGVFFQASTFYKLWHSKLNLLSTFLNFFPGSSNSTADASLFDDPEVTFKLLTQHGLTAADLCRLDMTSNMFHRSSPFSQGFLSLTEIAAFEICRKYLDPIPHFDVKTSLLPQCNYSNKMAAYYLETVDFSAKMHGKIAVGASCSLIVDNDGRAYVLGRDDGELVGRGRRKHYMVPTPVSNLHNFSIRQVAMTESHAILITECGRVLTSGILAGGPRLLPGLVSTRIASAAAGSNLNILISEQGEVFSFERSRIVNEPRFGGPNLVLDGFAPQRMEFFRGMFALRASIGAHHLLLLVKLACGKRRLYSYGFSVYGALGHGDEIQRLTIPRALCTFEDQHVVAFSAGAFHSAAVVLGGAVYTWGKGTEWQLGHGYCQHESLPVKLTNPKVRSVLAVDVACGTFGTVILGSLGEVIGFGEVWQPKGEVLSLGSEVRLIHACVRSSLSGAAGVCLGISRQGKFFVQNRHDRWKLGLGFEGFLDRLFFGLDRFFNPVVLEN